MSTIKWIYDRQDPHRASRPAAARIQALRDLVDPRYRVPEWMMTLRPTVDLGYCVPDPIRWTRVSDILGIEFQKYLSENISAEEALARAKRQIDKLYQ
jgi:hypothetical protein